MAQFGFGSNISIPFLGFSGSNNGNTEGGSNGRVTIITYIENFTGDTISNPVIVNNVMNVQVIEGGLTLTIIQDFNIVNNEIKLTQTVNNLNMTIINNNVNQSVIQNQIKGGYRNTEDAKAGGVQVEEMYYLITDNDPAMYSGVVVYIAQ